MIRRRLSALAVLLACGCEGEVAAFVPPSDYVVYVTPDAAQAGALQALQDWQAASGVRFTVGVTTERCDEPWTCFQVTMASPAAVQMLCTNQGAVGCTSAGLCAVSNNLSPEETMHTLRHEIGHALGLVHVQSVGELMYPTLDGAPTITPGDVAQYHALRAEAPRAP